MNIPNQCSRIALSILSGSLGLFATACGSGDGGMPPPSGGGGTPPPVQTAPKITSPGTASVLENTTSTIYAATATDPQGDPIIWDVFSGVDAGQFKIDTNGNLKFQNAPNYDLPSDLNQDNVYEVVLRARAGSESDTVNLRVTVQNDFEGIEVVRIAQGFSDPVGMTTRANGLKFLVAQRDGRIFEFDGQNGAVVEKTDEFGLRRDGEYLAIYEYFGSGGSAAGIMVVTHSPTNGTYLQSYHPVADVRGVSPRLAAPSSQPFKVSMWTSGKPFGGGSVLIAVGDPGGDVAQDSAVGYGKLYEAVPVDPYGGVSGGRRYGFSTAMIGDGIRAPGGGGLLFNGFTMMADQGGATEHKLTIFRYDWRPLDFGWPFYEGATAVRNDPPPVVNGANLVYRFGSGPGEGKGIVAGVGYAGSIPGIQGHYVFGDISGKIWSIPSTTLANEFRKDARSIERRTEDFKPDIGSINSPIAFGLASQTLFILDADVDVFRVDQR